MKVSLPTRRATIRLAKAFGPALLPSDLVILKGDLGAGKTFFVRALLRSLGVARTTPITSPTFTLVHEFESVSRGSGEGVLRVLHADAYRLQSSSEVDGIGLRDARANGAVLLVEWGTPFVSALGGDALTIHISLALSADAEPPPPPLNFASAPLKLHRCAELSANGARSYELLAEVIRAIGSEVAP